MEGNGDSEVIFGKQAHLEKNTAYSGGAIYATQGSVRFGQGAIIRENRTSGPGGAVYILDGSLHFSDGAVIESNEASKGGAVYAFPATIDISDSILKNNKANNGNGGALYVSGGSITVHDKAGEAAAGTLFKDNTSTAYGGAIYAQESSDIILGAGTLFDGNSAALGGAVFGNTTHIDLYQTGFTNNKATNGSGGAIYVLDGSIALPNGSEKEAASGTVFTDNSASSYGGAIYAKNSPVSLGSDTVFDGNEAKIGGAIFAQGSLDMTDTVFRNNSASQQGGAIYLQKGSLNFNVTKTSATPAISGNTSTYGGFLFLTSNSVATFDIHQGQQLQIGDSGYSGSNTEMDSIYMDGTSSIIKRGGGEMIINSSMDNLLGKVSIEEGTLSIARDWKIKNDVSISTGGTLDSSSFSFNGNNGKLMIAGGSLLTDTDRVFEKATGLDGTNSDPGNMDAHIDFSSGHITFRDARYNLEYASSAAQKLGITSSATDKEVTFTGELFNTDGTPVDSVNVSDLADKNLGNVVLGGTTITTGTDPSTGKNLIVGSDSTSVNHPQFDDAESVSESIGGRNLDLGPDGSGILVTGGKYLTLLGGESGTLLVGTGGDDARPVDVYLGATIGGKISEGTLNLGTTGLASSGTLSGNIQITGSSVVNVRGGDHSITGESGSATGPVSGVNNNGGTLNIDEQATLQTSVRQTTGETRVAGTLLASSVELGGGQFNVSGSAQIGQLKQSGGDTAITGTVEGHSLEVAGGTMSVTGTLHADNLVVSNGTGIAVGNGNAAGKLSSSSVTLNGGGIFLDPVWLGNDTIETASHGALVFNNQTVDGKLAVGRNSLLVLVQDVGTEMG